MKRFHSQSGAVTSKFLHGIIVIAVVGISLLLLHASMPDSASATKPSPKEVIDILKVGNERFVSGTSQRPHADAERLALAGSEDQGDHAIATVLTCSDSRVPVEILFDAGVMDIFVIRVAGNVVQTDEAGSIEYGIAHVHTPVMVVLGHTQCGAVKAVTQAALGEGHELERNIPPLVAPIVPAVKKAMHDHPDMKGMSVIPAAIEQNVWQSIRDLFMQSPTARIYHAEGKSKVVGAIYDVATGKVRWLPEGKVDSILKEVEADPNRAMNAMAEGEHHE
ncbi:carbonic anhydrase [Desulfovibrio inopinatus]|uniref:carbonic anhydrase n=1 Tax=Desulfovibrio inopinatus TaxID=102109 RepID=UPI000A0509B6|nr:carbonic anhydrase [Desulfovibrio inopinatus]